MTEYLEHYGVLGMKWGRRNSQTSSSGTRQESADHIRTAAIRKKHLSEMSNEEIKDLANRLDLEKRYNSLTAKELSPGRKAVNEALTNLGKTALTGVLTTAGVVAAQVLLGYASQKVKNPQALAALKIVNDMAAKKKGNN